MRSPLCFLPGALLTLALLAATGTAAGEKVYRWVDAQGRVHYGDQPQARNAQAVEVRPGSGPGAAAAQSAAAASSGAAPSTAECEQRRGRLETYRQAERIIETDALGNERVYSDQDREKLVARAEQAVAEACGEGAPR